MAAGSGTATYPTAVGEGVFSDVAGGLVGIAFGILTGSAIKNTDRALAKLYSDANFLAAQFAEFVIAELWWAAHLGTATSELTGYMAQAAGHVEKMADDELAAWQEFLDVKYPADLKDLYDLFAGRLAKLPKVNLAPLEAAIKKLQADDRKEQEWQARTATPKLNQWTQFYGTWKSTYVKPVTTLIGWLEKPSRLAEFATPPIVSLLPSYLSKRAVRPSATGIELDLLSTWTEHPDLVLNAVMAWLTKDA